MGAKQEAAPMGFQPGSRVEINQRVPLPSRPHQRTRSQRQAIESSDKTLATLTQIGGERVSHGEITEGGGPLARRHLRSSEWPLRPREVRTTVIPAPWADGCGGSVLPPPPPTTSQAGGLRACNVRRCRESQASSFRVGMMIEETLIAHCLGAGCQRAKLTKE